MKNKLAETARLVIRTRQLMTNLQQLKASAAASISPPMPKVPEEKQDVDMDDEGDDNLSMKSYGSHTHYPTKGKALRAKKKAALSPHGDLDEVEYAGSEEDDNFDELDTKDDGDEDEIEWGDEDGPNDDENVDDKPRRSIHSSHKQEEEEESPVDCFPPEFYQRFPFFTLEGTQFGIVWGNIRLKTFRLIENKYFETGVITMILLSSLALVSFLKE